jgi:hypothetical protein
MRYLFLSCFILLFASLGQAQSWVISGTVMDSTSREPLPLVAIEIRARNIGVSSAEDGSFSLTVQLGDTLIFSRLGYYPLYLEVVESMKHIQVLLLENEKLLKEVVVYDKILLPGAAQWKSKLKPSKPLTFENATMTQPNNIGIVPTFGPGMVFRFGGKDKTKEKREEQLKTRLYTVTVNSEEVKKQLMELYGISLETYYRKLEAFNKNYPAASYLTTREEIIEALIQYFAMKDP